MRRRTSLIFSECRRHPRPAQSPADSLAVCRVLTRRVARNDGNLDGLAGGRATPSGSVGVVTYAAGDGAVPLRQRVGHRQTLDGARSLQHVTRTALEADDSAHGKVVAHAPAVPRLRDGAALSGARLGHSFGWTQRGKKMGAVIASVCACLRHRVEASSYPELCISK